MLKLSSTVVRKREFFLQAYLQALCALPSLRVSGAFRRFRGLNWAPQGYHQGVELRENGITTLGPGVFDGLDHATQVWLGGNGLAEIQNGTFDGLDRLEDLRLNSNEITIIRSGVFAGLDQLVELYLHQNAITTVEDGAFDGLSRLEFVKLGPSQLDKGFVTCADVAHQLPARAVCEDE